MVNPAWFFSTLPQAIAAIVGLLVPLSAIQYQLERQRRERRTEELREETLEFTEKFGDILAPIAGEFFWYADNQYMTIRDDLDVSEDELNLDVVLNSHTPVVTLYYRHLVRVADILIWEPNPSADPRLHNLFSEKAFDRLRESSLWLQTHLDERSILIENLYADLRIESQRNEFTEDVFNPDPLGESIQEWLQRHQAYVSRHDQLLSGKNLQSFARVYEEFHGDFQRLDSLRQNSILTFNPNINSILLKSLTLLIVGVFCPIASLITNLPSVLSWLILDAVVLYIYQVSLLLASLGLTLSLIVEIQRGFGSITLLEYTREQIPDDLEQHLISLYSRFDDFRPTIR